MIKLRWPLMWRSTFDVAKAKGDKTFAALRGEIASLSADRREQAIKISDLELRLRQAEKNDHRDGKGKFVSAKDLPPQG